MPYNLSGACLVPTDDDTFYVMGGMSDEGGAYEYLTYVLQYSVSHMIMETIKLILSKLR